MQIKEKLIFTFQSLHPRTKAMKASSSEKHVSRHLLCLFTCTMTLLLLVGVLASDSQAEEPAFNPEYKAGDAKEPPKRSTDDLPKVDLDLRSGTIDERVERIMKVMSLDEKIGQLCQISGYGSELSDQIKDDLRAGQIGSLFYTGNAEQSREANRIAMEESRLGLPLLIPRDVIHGFRTVFPIPLGQAASWNTDLIREASAVASQEAAAEAVNWTFAPMLDVARDARWGRIAESVGEDPLLASEIGKAMVLGIQGDESDQNRGIAACAKHYVAYGLSEGGRDYNRSQVAVSELNNVFLPPFQAVVESGCATVMTGFNTINGVPATGHRQLVNGVLKKRWGFDGLVVSDWGSIFEMIEHGYAANEKQAARLAINAGLDMEMATDTFQTHMRDLLDSGAVKEKTIDEAVERILRVKLRFALPNNSAAETSSTPTEANLEIGRKLARQSMVLLKNEKKTLPLDSKKLKRIAVIGPLADAARDQLGCWMLDGKPEEAITPAAAIKQALQGQAEVTVMPTLASSVDFETTNFDKAVKVAKNSDAVVLCVGEGWLLSGEARSRAALDLPGAQKELVKVLTDTGTPVVMVVMAGRPLTIGEELQRCDAVLYAWHPGTMGGPALADLLLGKESPSGKLPVTFVKHVGQEPLYYNHPRTGRPALPQTKALIGTGEEDWPDEIKYKSHYLDVDPFPLFHFGYGLSYTTFEYGEPQLTQSKLKEGQTLGIRVELQNTGSWATEEIAQLYVKDVTARLVRPVRELKGFRRVYLEPGESTILEFALSSDDLAYYDNRARRVLEPGKFLVGVGGDSTAPLSAEFMLRKAPQTAEVSLKDLQK